MFCRSTYLFQRVYIYIVVRLYGSEGFRDRRIFSVQLNPIERDENDMKSNHVTRISYDVGLMCIRGMGNKSHGVEGSP